MGIGDKLREVGTQLQDGVASTSMTLSIMALRLITGIMLGLTIALILQEMIGYGTMSLVFCNVVVLGLFWRISRSWSLGQVLVFDIICVLVAQLLKMYIMLAP